MHKLITMCTRSKVKKGGNGGGGHSSHHHGGGGGGHSHADKKRMSIVPEDSDEDVGIQIKASGEGTIPEEKEEV